MGWQGSVSSDIQKYVPSERAGMSDDHDEDRPEYDPESPTVPEKEPPLRSTAPQSEFTMSQVGFGFVVLVVGLAVTFGLPLLF
jgi:hypothetical protein